MPEPGTQPKLQIPSNRKPGDPVAAQLGKAALKTPLRLPFWFWTLGSLIVGFIAGWISSDWDTALIAVTPFALLLALVSVLDRRFLITRFPGGEKLWKAIPAHVKTLFILRQALLRIPTVALPGIVLAPIVRVLTWPY